MNHLWRLPSTWSKRHQGASKHKPRFKGRTREWQHYCCPKTSSQEFRNHRSDYRDKSFWGHGVCNVLPKLCRKGTAGDGKTFYQPWIIWWRKYFSVFTKFKWPKGKKKNRCCKQRKKETTTTNVSGNRAEVSFIFHFFFLMPLEVHENSREKRRVFKRGNSHFSLFFISIPDKKVRVEMVRSGVQN